MKTYENFEIQKVLERLKLEIENSKKDQDPNRKTIYSKRIIDELKLLISKGVPLAFISKNTGVPTTTLYCWKDRSLNNTKRKGFNELKIVKEIKPASIKSESKISLTLGDDIQLSIPLDLMGPMLKVLKEEWYVSRI